MPGQGKLKKLMFSEKLEKVGLYHAVRTRLL